MLMGAHHTSLVVRAPFLQSIVLWIICNFVPVLMSQPVPIPIPIPKPQPVPVAIPIPIPIPKPQPQPLPVPLPVPQGLPPQNAISLAEAQALVKFKASLQPVTNERNLLPDWNPTANPPPCLGNNSVWIGVICYNNRVWGLQLQKMGLAGSLDFESLTRLQNFRILSIFNNKFEGPMPNLRRLVTLRLVYFSDNQFSGNIPDDAFKGLNGLRRLFLANNAFTGRIPSSVTTLSRLVELRLEGNRFEGTIPDFPQGHVPAVNVSHNQLEGPIPASLGNMSADSFSGNKGLCGPPLDDPCPINNPSSSKALIIALAILLLLLALAFLVMLCVLIRRRRNSSADNKVHDIAPVDHERNKGGMTDDSKINPRPTRKVAEVGKLIFARDDIEEFDLAELLRASAEVLGSGHFGSSYKAILPNGKPMVVKRFRHMNRMVRHDFHEHIMKLGKLRHPNVLPVLAYYYRREEKLFVLDFIGNGSLASKLHGNIKGKELDWPTRLKIIQGVAKGLAYLHTELHYNMDHIPPHGHVKSSNVLLSDSLEPLIMDYGLIPLVNHEQAQQVLLAYKSPDFSAKGNIVKKTDVWCIGILILEILTGKFPTSSLTVGKDDSMESWVEEISSSLSKSDEDVFDKDMGGIGNSADEIRKLLNIGLSCCQKDVDKRLDMDGLVRKIEEVKS